MADASEFFEENIRGLSDPEKWNLYYGLSEMADELSALHDQMNKLSKKSDDLSALHDQMNRLEAAVATIGRDMQEVRKSLRGARAAPKSPELRIKSRRRQPAADVQSSSPSVITKGEPPRTA
jgi:uncharacterized coiled-coil DUF342 family protein